MIPLIFTEEARARHLAAFHEGVMAASKALAGGDPVPWKKAHKDYLGAEGRADSAVKAFFAELHEYESDGRGNALLVGDADQMMDLVQVVDPILKAMSGERRLACRATLEQVLSYELFQKRQRLLVESGKLEFVPADWCGASYIKTLEVEVCPYCNACRLPRDLTIQFDHYLQKSDYPYLRLSLRNLIPVCSDCNHPRKNFPIKDFSSYAYPYRDSVHRQARFQLAISDIGHPGGGSDGGSCLLEIHPRYGRAGNPAVKWLQDLGIDDYYRTTYQGRIAELAESSNEFREEVVRDHQRLLGRRGATKVYKRYFKCSMKDEAINREELSKLTIDLVKGWNPNFDSLL